MWESSRSTSWRRCAGTWCVVWTLMLPAVQSRLRAQEPDPQSQPVVNQPAPDAAAETDRGPAGEELNLFQLCWQSRWWMLPIVLMSFLAVAVTVERFLGLRRARVIPDQLLADLGQLGNLRDGFDPREAYRICQRYPCAASNVIRAALLKVGRPHSEVEHAVQEASEREAERLYANVRWLNLASGVCPLMGLMGTVWGMIRAFHDTTQLMAGQNKADFLAEGIYLALVTTLGGLAVAIPATILSHYFESRVVSLFHQIDELLFNLLPQIEKYEGRVRFSQAQAEQRETGVGSEVAPLGSARK